jgi:glucose/arabinose dehydrogenase
MKPPRTAAAVLSAALLLAAMPAASQFPPPSPNVTTFATGLNNPRQLKFGPDGNLYVAEGGTGGSDSTDGECDQVVPPVGPYTGSGTGGRISKIDSKGRRTTVTDTLPSSQTSENLGNLVSGVADITWIGKTLYALLAGAGCSHGVVGTPNGVVRVAPNGSWSLLADLGAFQQANPVAEPQEADFEPDGTWYSMTTIHNALYAVEPNHGELDRVTRNGDISRVVDLSESQGHIVPTAMAFHNGYFYVSNLGTFPLVPAARVMRINPNNGNVRVVAHGFTGVLGIAFDKNDRLYVLEMSAVDGPTPATGRVVRVGANGGVGKVIATGLVFPAGMTIDPAGEILYISNFGFGFPPGAGQVVRVRVAR